MRTLVTGGAGFVGSHLVEALLARGDSVVVIDQLTTGSLSNLRSCQDHPRLRVVIDSVLNEPLMAQLMNDADVVFHLAAAVGVDYVLNHPLESFDTNIRGTDVVLRLAAERGIKVMLASTSEVYGKNDSGPLSEDADRILGPTRYTRWLYATSKAVDETMAYLYWRERSLPVVVFRLFNTIGPRQTGRYGMVVPRLVRQALRGEPLTVYGDGNQTRCFTYVADAVEAIIGLSQCSAALGDVFNIGQPREISIRELAEKIISLTGSTAGFKLVPYHEAYGDGYEDMRRRVPDVTKICRTIGFQPRYTIEQALEKIIEYERQQMT